MKEEINTYEYGYTQSQEVMLNAIGFLAMIDLLNEVMASQPHVFTPLVYADKTEEVKDEQGNLVLINSTWKEHNANSFHLSAVQEGGAIPGMTPLAFKCSQIVHALETIHRQNIEKGIATKITDLQEQDVLSKLS